MSSASSPQQGKNERRDDLWPALLLLLSLLILAGLIGGLGPWVLALAVAAYPVPLVIASGRRGRGLKLGLAAVLLIPVGVLLMLEARPEWNGLWLALPFSLHWMIGGLWLAPLAAVTWLYVRTFPSVEE